MAIAGLAWIMHNPEQVGNTVSTTVTAFRRMKARRWHRCTLKLVRSLQVVGERRRDGSD
jgi:hypothetical protein